LKPIQRILAQGHFDGLCLIYSLFNTYKALRSPSEKASDFAYRNSSFWRRVIGNTPSLHNFVLGGRFYNTTIEVGCITKTTSYPENINMIQLVSRA
jgi:hypothetical protein